MIIRFFFISRYLLGVLASLSSQNYVTECWLSSVVLMDRTNDVHSCTHPRRQSGTPRVARSEMAGGRLRTAEARSFSTSGGERSRSADISPLFSLRGRGLSRRLPILGRGAVKGAVGGGEGAQGMQVVDSHTYTRARTQSHRRLHKRARGRGQCCRVIRVLRTSAARSDVERCPSAPDREAS